MWLQYRKYVQQIRLRKLSHANNACLIYLMISLSFFQVSRPYRCVGNNREQGQTLFQDFVQTYTLIIRNVCVKCCVKGAFKGPLNCSCPPPLFDLLDPLNLFEWSHYLSHVVCTLHSLWSIPTTLWYPTPAECFNTQHTAGRTLHNNHLSPNTIPSYFTHNSTPSLKLSQSYYVSYYNAAVCMMLYLAINTKTAKHCIINYNASDWDALSRHQCIDIMFKRSLCFHLPQSRAVMQWRFCRQEPVHLSGSASGHSGVSIPSLQGRNLP